MFPTEFANSSMPRGDSKLPSHVTNRTEDGKILTEDGNLLEQGLPVMPPLPGETDEKTVEEIRRTIIVMGVGVSTSAQEVMDYFSTGAGEVKYFRWCSKDGAEDGTRFALVEFSDYGAIPAAMRLNNTLLGGFTVKVSYGPALARDKCSNINIILGLLQQSGYHQTSGKEQ